MSVSAPFVNRQKELTTLRESLETEKGELYSLVGESGSGKSALLEKFQDQCEDQSILTVRHDILEPKSANAFLYRFLESWKQSLPSSKWESIKERVIETDTGPLAQAVGTVDPTAGAGAQLVSAALSAFQDDELSDATDEVEFLIDILEEDSSGKTVILVDQFDERRLSDSLVADLDRMFRELSQGLPSNIVWIVGSDHDFDKYATDVHTLQIGSLEESAIEEFIEKSGTDLAEPEIPDSQEESASFVTQITNFDGPNLTKEGLIAEIKNKTKGHPFMLSLFLQTAQNEDIAHALHNLPFKHEDVRRHLREKFLDRMETDEEELLRDVCILNRYDVKLAAYVSDIPVTEARRILRRLERRAIIREIDAIPDKTTFRTHDLITDFLRNDIIMNKELQNRFRAIVAHSARVHEQLNEEGRVEEFGNPDLDFHCAEIESQIEVILDDREPDSIIESILETCDDFDYFEKEDVLHGLQQCYSVQSPDLLSETIQQDSECC